MKIAGEIQFFTEFFFEHDRDVDGSLKMACVFTSNVFFNPKQYLKTKTIIQEAL